ncbi:DUF202 domain-containing protein [Marmoricola endophyticus]|uniref:DUF202 domain-containing protein n=1 Tax=Marmoricola endophyticus TaxID=2040280 RepID=UPI001E36F51A|nr:DUF202 domain-containing protein [Marmoricola endophyticus]
MSDEPDYRFTLANERTFLAWMRTCLALLAAAVAVVQLAPDLGSRPFREVCAVVLALLAAASAVAGVRRWVQAERDIRAGAPLRQGRSPYVLAAGLALVAAAVVVVTVVRIA